MNVYIFFRDGHFYPLCLRDDEDAIKNAELNARTSRVEDIEGRIVWEVTRQ